MGTRLFVGGLSWGTDDAGLRAAFEPFGEITDVRVVLDRETGRSRGFGFVAFATEEQAKAAVEAMEGAELDGRRLRVNEAQERGGGGPRGPRRNFGGPATVERRPSSGDRRPGPGGGGYRGGGGGGGFGGGGGGGYRGGGGGYRGGGGGGGGYRGGGGGFGGPPGGGFGGPPSGNFGPPPGDDGFEGKPGASRRRGKGKKRKEHDPWGGDTERSGRGRKGRGKRDWTDWDEDE